MNRLGIFPWPQWLSPQHGTLSLRGDGMSLWLGETCKPVLAGTTPVLDVWRVSLPTTADAGRATVVIGGVHEPEVAARLSRHPGLLAEALPAEGYVLAVDDGGVTIGGADARGCLYGLSTVAQLIGQQGSAGSVPYLELRDWPHKPMRGAHVYMPGRDDIPYFRRLLAWLAALKYNYLFLEVGGGMRYDRHPEVNEGWAHFCDEVNAYPGGPPAMQGSQSYPKDSTHTELGGGRWLEKEEVADLVAYANSLGIEVVPEMQSLSHAYYLVVAHPEIAERPYDPWPDTYCPSNPRSYELYFDLLDEVIEVLHPRMVHIGHDEAYTIGLCDRCRGKSGAELLAGDLRKIHDYLADRGIRTVLWGEKLQNLIVGGDDQAGRASHHADASRKTDHTMRETYQAVDFVPKDILIFDWYWAADPYSERFFRRKGFQSVYGNFGQDYSPHTFFQWDKRSRGESVLGAEVSTWCHVDDYAFGHNLIPFRFLFSANLLWWSHYTDREREMNMSEVARLQPLAWQALNGGSLPSRAGASSAPVTLAASAEATPTALDGADGAWTSACPVAFDLSGPAMSVTAAAPASATIPIDRRARGLVFLHYCLTRRQQRSTWTFADAFAKDDHNLMGKYVIEYAGGAVESIEIRHADNISRPDLVYGEGQSSCPFWAQPAWEGRDREGKRVTLWAHEWINPHPDEEITSFRLEHTGGEPDERIVLLALTALG